MTREEHRTAVHRHMQRAYPADEETRRALTDALYAANELGLLLCEPDALEALRIWSLVEAVREGGFPDNLRM